MPRYIPTPKDTGMFFSLHTYTLERKLSGHSGSWSTENFKDIGKLVARITALRLINAVGYVSLVKHTWQPVSSTSGYWEKTPANLSEIIDGYRNNRL